MTMDAIDQGSCPYLDNRRWVSNAFVSERMPAEIYEGLINEGWRRSGTVFYRNHCPGCSLCIPIRTDVQAFRASKSQRRVLRRNTDVTIDFQETGADQDLYELYRRYQRHQHKQNDTAEQDWDSFVHFLGSSPVSTLVMRYRVDGALIGAGWVDVLPNGLSSVYFAFDPTYRDRSPGTFSALQEICLASELGRPWLYLGFFVPSCRSMSYKARFRPYELLIDGRWNRWR
jgi:leucyl-tRNA---protein transferase